MFGFLGAIPGILGHGAAAAGKGIFSGLKKVPRLMGGEDGGEEMPQRPGLISEKPQTLFDKFRTPDFNPNARSRMIANAQPQGEPDVFADRPSPLRSPNIRPRPLEYPSPSARNADENAPIVAQPGSPTFRRKTPYEEVYDAKVDYNQGYKPPTGLGDRLKRGIVPAITGALKGYGATGDAGGAIGGALGGFGGATIAPRQTYEAEFDQKIKPQILERQKAEREQGLLDEARRKSDLENQLNQARIAQERAQTAGMASPEEARAERAARIGQIGAQTEATRRGKPSYQTIKQPDGRITIVADYPDGTREIGESGAAAIKAEDRTSREKIATERNAAAMARTQATQGAISARQKAGGGKAGKKYVSITDIREYAKKHGISESQAAAQARQEGFTPVR